MSSRAITQLSYKEANRFFKKHSSYVNFDLPEYFNFEQLLTFVSASMSNKELKDICTSSRSRVNWPSSYEQVNHIILSNKDGAYSWRPMSLIHPVLYINLVKLLTKKSNWTELQNRFNDFSKSSVHCISIPRESDGDETDKASQIRHWWERIEQRSIKKSLEYNYIFLTDITDCYGSIYTHSIEWSIAKDGKEGVKARLNNRASKPSLGKSIDIALKAMNYNQTNGIPQGSTLMDFVAEIVLGYADEQLTEKINKTKINKSDFYIIRYRDDYRIFVNDPNIGHEILKLLSTVMYDLGLKMNPSKTMNSDDVIMSSVKKEKLERILISPSSQHWQKEALRIYQLSKKYPNSGLISKELSIFFDRLPKHYKNKDGDDIEVLVVIFAMIAYCSPGIINWASAIISKFLEDIKNTKQRDELVKRIYDKFKKIPNTGFIDVWLQRISAPLGLTINYSDPLTKVALEEIKNNELWNSQWLKKDIKDMIDFADISELKSKLEQKILPPVVQRKEVELFRVNYF